MLPLLATFGCNYASEHLVKSIFFSFFFFKRWDITSADGAIVPSAGGAFFVVTRTHEEARWHGKYCNGSQFDAWVYDERSR